ncbi:MAG: hypothetical protein ABJO36_13560 [Litorimonas sp.]
MSDILNTGYSQLHLINLALHIGAGTIAIGLGFLQYFTVKGSPRHIRIGKAFIILFAIVLITAIFGNIVFRFRAYLAVLTLSAAYGVISAIRVFRIKEIGPQAIDNLLSILFGATAIGMMLFIPIPAEESAGIFRVTLGTLIGICLYDLARNINGAAWLRRSWLNEHIYKMIGSHSALLTAAAGNLFIELQPWSIIAPTTICMFLIIFFILRHPLSSRKKT